MCVFFMNKVCVLFFALPHTNWIFLDTKQTINFKWPHLYFRVLDLPPPRLLLPPPRLVPEHLGAPAPQPPATINLDQTQIPARPAVQVPAVRAPAVPLAPPAAVAPAVHSLGSPAAQALTQSPTHTVNTCWGWSMRGALRCELTFWCVNAGVRFLHATNINVAMEAQALSSFSRCGIHTSGFLCMCRLLPSQEGFGLYSDSYRQPFACHKKNLCIKTENYFFVILLGRQFIFSTIISDYEADSSGDYDDSRKRLVQPGHAYLSIKNIMQRDVARLHLMF